MAYNILKWPKMMKSGLKMPKLGTPLVCPKVFIAFLIDIFFQFPGVPPQPAKKIFGAFGAGNFFPKSVPKTPTFMGPAGGLASPFGAGAGPTTDPLPSCAHPVIVTAMKTSCLTSCSSQTDIQNTFLRRIGVNFRISPEQGFH